MVNKIGMLIEVFTHGNAIAADYADDRGGETIVDTLTDNADSAGQEFFSSGVSCIMLAIIDTRRSLCGFTICNGV